MENTTAQTTTSALPALTGTDKQITWGTAVRAAVLKKLATVETSARETIAECEAADDAGDPAAVNAAKRLAEVEELRTKILTLTRWRSAKEFCDGAGATIAYFAAKSGCAWYLDSAWVATTSVRVLPPTA